MSKYKYENDENVELSIYHPTPQSLQLCCELVKVSQFVEY